MTKTHPCDMEPLPWDDLGPLEAARHPGLTFSYVVFLCPEVPGIHNGLTLKGYLSKSEVGYFQSSATVFVMSQKPEQDQCGSSALSI